MTRRVKYRIKEINEGEMFGHEEILSGTRRCCRVYALHEAKVFYLNEDLFREWFPPDKLKQLQNKFPPIDFNDVGK